MVDIKKAKVRKKKATKGEASQPRDAVTKKPRVVFKGPSTSARVPPMHQTRSLVEEDNEVEVVPAPEPTILVSSSALTIPITIPKKSSTLVRAETKRKVKAPMALKGLKEAVKEDEYWEISAIVLKDALAIEEQKSSQEDGKNNPLAARLEREKESTTRGEYQVFLLEPD